MLKVVLPKGSLEKATFDLFAEADLSVIRSSDVEYSASIADPRVESVKILRPQEIPIYVGEGLFDIGITGRDWIEETGSNVISLGKLNYSKATSRPIKVVLAVLASSDVNSVSELKSGLRVSTEYPLLTEKFLKAKGIQADIRLSYGATEAKIPDIADAVVEITETGRALKAAGLKVIEEILVSHTELIANPISYDDLEKRHAMEQLLTLLNGSLEARGKVLVKLNVDGGKLNDVLALLPSLKSPTISELSGGGAFAVETVVLKSSINILIPDLKDKGATDILEIPLSKIVH